VQTPALLTYDRHLDPRLLDLLRPEGALSWLTSWVRTDEAEAQLGSVQFRRDRGSRKYGGIQVYTGRTSPFEVKGTARGFKLSTNDRYVPLDAELFGRTWSGDALAGLGPRLLALLRAVPAASPDEFLAGEAVVHSGLTRSLGPLAEPGAPYRAVDTEARMAFRDTPSRTAFQASLPERCGLPDAEQLPQKLDLVCVRDDGALVLVEVKDAPTGLARAAWQAATHVARFTALLEVQPAWATTTWVRMLSQRHAVGLLGPAPLPPHPERPDMVAVVAAPDPREDWFDAWRRAIEPIRAQSRGTLDHLRFWRLDAQGRLLEDREA